MSIRVVPNSANCDNSSNKCSVTIEADHRQELESNECLTLAQQALAAIGMSNIALSNRGSPYPARPDGSCVTSPTDQVAGFRTELTFMRRI